MHGKYAVLWRPHLSNLNLDLNLNPKRSTNMLSLLRVFAFGLERAARRQER